MISKECLIQVLAMCFIRKSLDYVFTRHELKWLDDIMPEANKREKEDKKKKMLEEGDVEEAEDVVCLPMSALVCIYHSSYIMNSHGLGYEGHSILVIGGGGVNNSGFEQ